MLSPAASRLCWRCLSPVLLPAASRRCCRRLLSGVVFTPAVVPRLADFLRFGVQSACAVASRLCRLLSPVVYAVSGAVACYLQGVVVTPAVNPRLAEFLRFDIRRACAVASRLGCRLLPVACAVTWCWSRTLQGSYLLPPFTSAWRIFLTLTFRAPMLPPVASAVACHPALSVTYAVAIRLRCCLSPVACTVACEVALLPSVGSGKIIRRISTNPIC